MPAVVAGPIYPHRTTCKFCVWNQAHAFAQPGVPQELHYACRLINTPSVLQNSVVCLVLRYLTGVIYWVNITVWEAMTPSSSLAAV